MLNSTIAGNVRTRDHVKRNPEKMTTPKESLQGKKTMIRPAFKRNVFFLVLTTLLLAPSVPLLAEDPSARTEETTLAEEPGVQVGEAIVADKDLEDAREVDNNPVAKKLALAFENILSMANTPGDATHEQLRIKALFYNSFDKWFLVHRPVLPVYYKPDSPEEGRNTGGLGDLIYRFYYAPKGEKGILWGFGPVAILPTATDKSLGAGKWSIGPAIGIITEHGKTTFGLSVWNAWSVAGDSDRPSVNLMQVVPIFSHAFGNGWYIGSSPEIFANWNLEKKNRWIVPVGASIGKAFRIGNQAVAFKFASYYNVERPEGASEWDVRVYVNFLLTRTKKEK